MVVGTRGIIEPGSDRDGLEVRCVFGKLPDGDLWKDDVVLPKIIGGEGIGASDHLLMNFLAWSDANDGMASARSVMRYEGIFGTNSSPPHA